MIHTHTHTQQDASQPNVQPSTMFIRDNLEVMRGIDSECIDLIYLDPPFNSKHNYAAPIGSEAAGAEFKDTWSLSDIDAQWISSIAKEHPQLHQILSVVPDDSDKSYLAYMAIRLLEMHRILKPTGSIYFHCDPTMNSWIRIVLDAIFGRNNFRNEIVWGFKWGGTSKKYFARKHQTLFWYSKTQDWTFNIDKVREPYTTTDPRWHNNKKGKVIRDLWDDIATINTEAKERTGYPTQKPLPLLERVINASSNEDEWVLDPFCGCATTCVAAHKLGRRWIGIDISSVAEILVRRRIDEELGPEFLYNDNKPEFYQIHSSTDIPTRSGKKVDPREYKPTLYGIQEGYCNGCGKHFHMRNLTIDHIVPRAKGGQDLETNLQLLCGHCNSTKGDRDMAYLKALWQSYTPTQSIP